MDYPTPEEEYELMYGEELDMMDDFDGKSIIVGSKIEFINFLFFSFRASQNCSHRFNSEINNHTSRE